MLSSIKIVPLRLLTQELCETNFSQNLHLLDVIQFNITG